MCYQVTSGFTGVFGWRTDYSRAEGQGIRRTGNKKGREAGSKERNKKRGTREPPTSVHCFPVNISNCEPITRSHMQTHSSKRSCSGTEFSRNAGLCKITILLRNSFLWSSHFANDKIVPYIRFFHAFGGVKKYRAGGS